MTREEAKSCISTIEMLQRLAYNIHGVMDVIDADNCEKIIKALEQEPKTGHWIEDDMTYCGVDLTNYKCDKCGEIGGSWRKGLKPDKLPKYCMNCGCRMVEPQETETWNGIHGQITAPKGTFERIFNDADDDNDI